MFGKVVADIQAGCLGIYAAELLYFLFKISESMLEPSVRLFVYEGVCLQEVQSVRMCQHLNSHPRQEAIVQSKAAMYIMFYKVLQNVPAVILVLFCGAWSDRSGRKLPAMLTCFGGIVSVLLYMVSTQIRANKAPFLPLVLVGAAVKGACGRSAVMNMACHSYVSDISTRDARTRKISHLLGMSHLGYLAGCTIAGSLLDSAGFLVIFCIVVFLQATTFLAASICMRDTVRDSSGQERIGADCKPSHFVESFQVLLKKRPGHKRIFLVMLFTACILQQTCKSGEVDITTLFVQRAPLSWPKSLLGYLLAMDAACLSVMALLVFPVLIKCCHLEDTTVVLIGLFFKIVRTLFLSMSTTTWMMFTAVSIGSPIAATVAGLKSIISKMVDDDEIGRAFSLLSSVENLSNILGAVIFANVYGAMQPIWPGFAYIVEAGIYIILLIIMIGLACCARNYATMSTSGTGDKIQQNEANRQSYGSLDGRDMSGTSEEVEAVNQINPNEKVCL